MIFLLLPAAVGIGILLSLAAAAPGIVGGDGPELAAAAFYLGPAHPPGYPLFVLLGHLFELLPLGTPAFRLTFFSISVQWAAFAAAVWTLSELLPGTRTLLEKRVLSLLASGLVFSGPLLFHQTAGPEVFALHLLFVSLLLRVVLLPSRRTFWMGTYIAALALSNQHLTFLLLPALFWAAQSIRDKKFWITAASFGLLGLSPYLLLPLRSALGPAVDWGDPSNFSRFFQDISRSQYGGDLAKGSLADGWSDFLLYGKLIFCETWGLSLLFVFLGFWKGKNRFGAPYFIGLACLGALLPFLIRVPDNSGNDFVTQAFLTPALLWLSPLLMLGLDRLYEITGAYSKALLVCVALWIGANFFLSFRANNLSQNLEVEAMARNILAQMPSRSVLYSEGDGITFPLAYAKLVLGLRQDGLVYDRTRGLFPDLYNRLSSRGGGTDSQKTQVEEADEKESRPSAVFYSESEGVPGRVLIRTGLLFQAQEKSQAPALLSWDHFQPPKAEPNHDYLSRETAARFYLFKASHDYDGLRDSEAAARDLNQAAWIGGDNSRVLVNAGTVENDHGATDQASQLFEKACEADPGFYLAWYDLGVTAAEEGRALDSIGFLRRSIGLHPDAVDAHSRLAFQYYQSRNYAKAAEEWETTRQLAPQSPDAYRNLGLLYTQTRPDYASFLLRQYLGLNPQAADRGPIEKWLAGQAPK